MIVSVDLFPVGVPYKSPEISSVVFRRGVSAVLVKVRDSEGRIGWGEACVGASSEAILSALRTMVPFVVGRETSDYEHIRAEIFHRGLWAYQPITGSYAWCAVEMALLDLVGQANDTPVWALLGELQREEVDYFYYFSSGSTSYWDEQITLIEQGDYRIVYVKVGVDHDEETALLRYLRKSLGPEIELRVDANGAWNSADAHRILSGWSAEIGIGLCEQPVAEFPPQLMRELREKVSVPLAANEGMGPAPLAEVLIRERVADVYTFSPYWVGGVFEFLRLSSLAADHQASICRHTHGELGVAATAFHHVALVTPALVRGNQQTAAELEFDVVTEPVPTRTLSRWEKTDRPGLGIEVDEASLLRASEIYADSGQFLPYSPSR